jgi:hypothetical protein
MYSGAACARLRCAVVQRAWQHAADSLGPGPFEAALALAFRVCTSLYANTTVKKKEKGDAESGVFLSEIMR